MSTGPLQHHLDHEGVDLAFVEWNPEARGRGPSLLLAHATGFHARCWDPVIARLDPVHVIATDARGHGHSANPEITHWGVFGEDLTAVVRHLGLERIVGVGHSMGGHALVDAAAACSDAFTRLLLIDPVIAPEESYQGPTAWSALPPGTVHPTAKRKNHFASPEAMIERFEDREPYSFFTREALEAYCRHGLVPAPDGDGYVLACPPTSEASVYMTSRTNKDVFESVRAIKIPVHVLRARITERLDMMDFTSSPTWPGLADAFADGHDEQRPELTHFIPMQDPDLTARRIREQLARA